jgi:hypothetical protein
MHSLTQFCDIVATIDPRKALAELLQHIWMACYQMESVLHKRQHISNDIWSWCSVV